MVIFIVHPAFIDNPTWVVERVLRAGITNKNSLPWSSVQHFRRAGAEFAARYFIEKDERSPAASDAR